MSAWEALVCIVFGYALGTLAWWKPWKRTTTRINLNEEAAEVAKLQAHYAGIRRIYGPDGKVAWESGHQATEAADRADGGTP